MKVIEGLYPRTPEWYARRPGTVTGTVAAAIDGTSEYATALICYEREKGILPPEDTSGKEFAFLKGDEAEDELRTEYLEKYGLWFEPICIEHPENPRLWGSVDGYNHDANEFHEYKLMREDLYVAFKTKGIVPPGFYSQVQFYMGISGVPRTILHAKSIKFKEEHRVVVESNPSYQSQLFEKIEKYLHCLDNNIPPDPTERDFFKPDVLSDPNAFLFSELRAAHRVAENAKKNYERVKNRIFEVYGQDRNLYCSGVTLQKSYAKGPIKYPSIPEVQGLSPDYLEQFRGPISVRWTPRFEKETEKETSDE